jgi:hypothetical protein
MSLNRTYLAPRESTRCAASSIACSSWFTLGEEDIAIHGSNVTRRSAIGALIEATVVTNAALAAYTVQQELGTRQTDLRAAYGVYLLSERQVWAPRHGSAECIGLAYPPTDDAAFGDFGDRVVQSERIAALLAKGAE